MDTVMTSIFLAIILFFNISIEPIRGESKIKLAQLLIENKIEDIPRKQAAIKELSKKKVWRQRYSATASLLRVEMNLKIVANWIKNHHGFLPSQIPILTKVFFMHLADFNPAIFLGRYEWCYRCSLVFIGLAITARYIKKINKTYQNSTASKELFKQYYQLVELIEETTFESELLQAQKKELTNQKEKASATIKRFFKILEAFDQRNNMIFGLLGNAFSIMGSKSGK